MLVEGRAGGVHMAVSPDQFRMIYFQGHPEYDLNSLLKEYKREVSRYLAGELDAPPPALLKGEPLPDFAEKELEALLDNTWGDTAKAMVNNWLGLVYSLTNLDRHKQFMDEIDPDDPLGIKAK